MVVGRGTQISQLCRAVLTEFSKLWNGLFSHALFKQCILAMIVIIIGKNNGPRLLPNGRPVARGAQGKSMGDQISVQGARAGA